MNKKSFIIFCTIFLLTTANLFAKTDKESTLMKLDQITDEALQMVQLNRNHDAKRLLDYFSDQLLAVNNNEQLFSMDELRIISMSHEDALQAITNEEMQQDDRIKKVMQLRLVTDAIISHHEPLWTGMESQLMTVLYDMKEAIFNGENETFHYQLNHFLSLYEIIYPSLKIDVSIETMQQLDTRISYIDQYRQQLLTDISGQRELEVLEANLKNIFSRVSEDEADPSLWWVIISTGSVIIVTLSYVGWRKYVGDKQNRKVRSNRRND